jgi:RNA polymerase sigma factor (sigma-70 family)
MFDIIDYLIQSGQAEELVNRESPEIIWRREKRKEIIHKAISNLKPKQQLYIKEMFFNYLTAEQIAAKYEVTKRSVNKVISEAKKKLRQQLKSCSQIPDFGV